METNVSVRTVDEVTRPSFNDWVKEFKVSSQYVSPPEVSDHHEFDVKKFVNNLKQKKWEE